jgi:hypothetical protein
MFVQSKVNAIPNTLDLRTREEELGKFYSKNK